MTARKPTVISAFAGCGGSSLGYRVAGFRELLAIEYDPHAVQVFKANFPDVPVFDGDIADLSVDECLERTGLDIGVLDVLDGSPPCQGFSTAGRRQADDARNDLFLEFVRLLDGLKPKAFVMENVKGLTIGKMRPVFLHILDTLRKCGYRTVARILNATHYGVPQNRLRLIVIGVREDIGIEPSHPKPQTRPKSVRDAIGHLPVGKRGNRSQCLLKAWEQLLPGQAMRKAFPGVGQMQSYRIDPAKPSPAQIKSSRNFHWRVCRNLSIPEESILQGFPESFKWPGGVTACHERIGNSVPPPMVAAIAGHIRESVLTAYHSIQKDKSRKTR